MKSWSPTPDMPMARSRAHDRQSVGHRNWLINISVMSVPTIMAKEYQTTTTAMGVVFSFRSVMIAIALPNAPIAADKTPSNRFSGMIIEDPNRNFGFDMMTTPA